MSPPHPSTSGSAEILLIHDSHDQAQQLKHLLEQQGHTVTLVPNGKEALEAACTQKPSLIVTDIAMPELGGYALCKRLKMEKELQGVPVILMTSLSGTEDLLQSLGCGADLFIRKPYKEAAFLSRIEYVLSNRRLRESAEMEGSLQIKLGESIYQVTSAPQQMLDWLISAYEDAGETNAELSQEQAAQERTRAGSNRKVNAGAAPVRSQAADHAMATERFRQSEEQFRVITESISDLIAVLDLDGKRLYNSPAYKRILGDSAALVGSDSFNEIHPDDRERIRTTFHETVRTGRGQRAEYRFLLRDGSTRYIESQGSVIPDREGKASKIVVVSRDVTERKRAEEAMRQREAMLSEALLAAQMGVWEWTLSTNAVSWDENLYRIAGRDPNLPPPSFEEHQKIFGGESWERLLATVQNAFATGTRYELDLDLIRPDSSKRWLIGRGEPLRDASGRMTHLRGTVQDITDRKQAENALRRRAEFDELMAGILGRFARCAWFDVDSSVVHALRAVAEFIGADHAFVIIFSADDHTWSGTHEWCGPDVPPRLQAYQNMPAGTLPWCERRLVANEIIRINSPDELPPEAVEERRNYEAEGTLSVLDVPIKVAGGGITGCVGFHSKARPIAWSDTGVSQVRILGDAIAGVIERKRTEEALRESERKYRELVQHANSIILRWTRDGRVLFLNEFGQRFFGYTGAEICGRHVIGTIVPETDSSGRKLAPLMGDICSNPEAFEQVVNENIRHGGERVWIAWTNKVVPDEQGQAHEILSIGTDITARKQAEEELRRSESKYRTLVETSQDVIWSVDRECRITFMSPAARSVYGYEPDELLGRHLTDLVPAEWLDRELEEIERVKVKGASTNYEHIFLRKDGTPVYLSCNSVALRDDHGHLIGAMGVSTDITERKRVEEELQAIQASLERRVTERTAELAVARDRAEMADRTKSAFLATMSHELRTPLNSIIGFTGLLLQGLAGPLNPEQAKQLSMVKISGQHLLALINDVLDISKIEAGQIEIANTPFDLSESIQKVVQTVTPLAQKKQLPLITQIGAAVGRIISDRRRVEQILLNVLSNAIKFTERGEVTLSADITPGTDLVRHPAVRISVADTGIGIKREDLDKLFQPFRQLDTGLTRQHEGTGLGLAICKRLVERLGGTISVESEHEKGSVFQCVLPIHPEGKS